jgi:hypothetical protein
MEQQLTTLSNYRGAPAVTILLSTHRTHPDNKQDSIHLKNLLSTAEERLYSEFEKREVWPVLDHLKTAEASINHDYNLDTLAIYANSDSYQVLRLPVAATDRVVIGDRFEIRPLLKALQQSEHYYILTIGRQKIRLLEAFNDTIVKEVKNHDFPYENSYFTTDPLKLQQASVQDDLLKEFFNTADKRFKPYYYANPLPVILLGEARNCTLYQEQMDIKNIVIGTHPGSYDDTTDHNIVKVTFPLIQQHIAQQQETAIEDIGKALSAQRLLVDLSDIYTAATAGQAATLYIEKDYFQPGKIDEQTDTITITTDPKAPDVTLNIIERVINNGGKVMFMDNNTLNEFQGMALATRF